MNIKKNDTETKKKQKYDEKKLYTQISYPKNRVEKNDCGVFLVFLFIRSSLDNEEKNQQQHAKETPFSAKINKENMFLRIHIT